MGDRFGRRNRLVDDAVDVDAAVVPAPAVPEPEPVEEAAPPEPPPVDELDDDVEELEEADGRFSRRNPLVDRSLGGGDTT